MLSLALTQEWRLDWVLKLQNEVARAGNYQQEPWSDQMPGPVFQAAHHIATYHVRAAQYAVAVGSMVVTIQQAGQLRMRQLPGAVQLLQQLLQPLPCGHRHSQVPLASTPSASSAEHLLGTQRQFRPQIYVSTRLHVTQGGWTG